MALLKEPFFSPSSENESAIVLNPDGLSNIHSVTPRDFIIEYQNQMKLSRQGLEFIFDLYKNAGSLNTRVSNDEFKRYASIHFFFH